MSDRMERMTENQYQPPTREQIAEAIETATRQWWFDDQGPEEQGHEYLARFVQRAVLALFQQPTPEQECGVCGRRYPASDTRGTCPVCWPGFGEHGQQPTPSAELAWTVVLVKRGGHYRYVKVVGGDWDGALEQAERANEGWEALQCGPFVDGTGIAYHSTINAEPVSIADMAPGTTFTARHVDPDECGGIDHRWFVIRPGARPLVISDEGQHWSGDSVDPSTIRDVTPPKGDGRG